MQISLFYNYVFKFSSSIAICYAGSGFKKSFRAYLEAQFFLFLELFLKGYLVDDDFQFKIINFIAQLPSPT